ncbi:MAG TPA: hypothetical protein VGQ58_06245 [Candidatus Limnocylindrales bacterium]|jgi:hypothetical protein|nr:hypothetical protein [Candidatus Limnocylindrales bacterium]
MTPSPPYLATVVVAILLMIVGLSLEGSLFSVAAINQVADQVLGVIGVDATRDIGRVLIVAAPTLLIVGSLFRGL